MTPDADQINLPGFNDELIIGPQLRDRAIEGVNKLKLPKAGATGLPIPTQDGFVGQQGMLLYRKQLTPSDAETKKNTTHPKGCLTLAQAGFLHPETGLLIDQTKYFRNEAFPSAEWVDITGTPKPTEQTRLYFAVRINRHYYGIFKLTVQHKPSGTANQGNSPTVLMWGPLKPIIRAVVSPGQWLDLHGPVTSRRWLYFLEIK